MSKDNNIIEQSLQDTLKNFYINYAYETIEERAIPNINDGLKPVHLRILYSMNQLGLGANAKTLKCARVVGDVLGKYHAHGDSSVYGALITQSQDWVMRYPTIYVHGNNGSRDNDPAAAMRYTETRLTRYGEAMLNDLNKNVVDFQPNFDDTLTEPVVLGTLLPNLLANGTPAGIACGFATTVPPHNLNELYDAIIFMIQKALKDEEYTAADLLQFIKAPDFPTGGIITSIKDMPKAMSTGKGKITVRCKYEIKEDKKNTYIEITELPYLVNKLKLVESIEKIIADKKIEGLKEITDSSKGDDVLIRIDLKKNANADLIMKQLLAKTDLRVNVSYNIVAVNNDRDILTDIGILDCLEQFIIHSMAVVRRRSQYDLSKLNHNILILEGVQKAIENIDRVIEIVRTEDNPVLTLQDELELEEEQAKYVYDMKISRLSKVSEEKVETDLSDMYDQLPHLVGLVEDDEELLKQLIDEFTIMKDKYGDDRRTVIELEDEIELVDLVKDEELIVTITSDQNIKAVSTKEYNKQNRAGKGSQGAATKEDEIVTDLFSVNSKDDLLFITNTGRCHTIKAYKIPKVSRNARGKNLANFVSMEEGEHPIKTLATNLNDKERYLVLVTRKGQIKRLALAQLSNRFNVTKVMGLVDDDEIVDALLATDDEEVMVITANSMSARFNSNTVRPSGRAARGVKGISLGVDDAVIGIVVMKPNEEVVTVTKYGIAKATKEEEFASKSRGCKGIYCHKISDKTGPVVSAFILDNANILVATANGKTIRIDSENIAHSGRHTTGTKLINLDKDDFVVAVTCLPEEQVEEIENE